MTWGNRGDNQVDWDGEDYPEPEWEYEYDSRGEVLSRHYIGDRYHDRTKLYGTGINESPDSYINSAWKHMLSMNRPSSTITAEHQAIAAEDTNEAGVAREVDFTVPDKEKLAKWNRYADSANQYIRAARSNKRALQRGNRLLVGEALEDEMNNVGGRGGKAIREVRTA